jgi:hypothetical protein
MIGSAAVSAALHMERALFFVQLRCTMQARRLRSQLSSIYFEK